ncbi:MAG: peptidylprolyl isomerase [Desulfobulbaceae bacterium]|nr:peptidylprolyl isomerase [Desulfobulbaceae bacterium]
MQRVKENDSVTVIYDGAVQDGEIFESSEDTGPLQFTLGTQSVMPLFEEAVLGMAVGEKKSITISPTEAYGDRVEALVQDIDRSIFKGKDIQPGMTLSMDMEKDGKTHKVPATVLSITDDAVTVDFNHPLAGQFIVYTITLKEIQPAAQ